MGKHILRFTRLFTLSHMLTLYGIHSVTADCDVFLSHVGGGGGGRVSWDKICAQRYPVKRASMNQSNPKRSHQTTSNGPCPKKPLRCLFSWGIAFIVSVRSASRAQYYEFKVTDLKGCKQSLWWSEAVSSASRDKWDLVKSGRDAQRIGLGQYYIRPSCQWVLSDPYLPTSNLNNRTTL